MDSWRRRRSIRRNGLQNRHSIGCSQACAASLLLDCRAVHYPAVGVRRRGQQPHSPLHSGCGAKLTLRWRKAFLMSPKESRRLSIGAQEQRSHAGLALPRPAGWADRVSAQLQQERPPRRARGAAADRRETEGPAPVSLREQPAAMKCTRTGVSPTGGPTNSASPHPSECGTRGGHVFGGGHVFDCGGRGVKRDPQN